MIWYEIRGKSSTDGSFYTAMFKCQRVYIYIYKYDDDTVFKWWPDRLVNGIGEGFWGDTL